MSPDFATFHCAVYALVADAWQALPPAAHPPHPGPARQMDDPEIVSVLVLRHYLGLSERGVLRLVATMTPPPYRHLLSQSAFNRRARHLGERLGQVLTWLAIRLDVARDAYEILDGVPVPVAARARAERHRLFTDEEIGIGRGGVGKTWYAGVALVLSVAASGPITGGVVAPANTGERWLGTGLLEQRHAPGTVASPRAALAAHGARTDRYVSDQGPVWCLAVGVPVTGVYLADQGFGGPPWHAWWRDLGATVLTPQAVRPVLRRGFHRARQTIERVFAALIGHLHLRTVQARTMVGLQTRILTTCLAFNLGMLINRLFGRRDFQIGTLCLR